MNLTFRLLIYSLLMTSTLACTTSVKIKSGTEAYELKKYSLAVPMLEEDFAKAKDNSSKAAIALKIAKSLDFQNKFEDAEKWYDSYRNLSLETDAPIQYAKALMRNEKYAEAQKIIKEYLTVNRQDRLLYGPLLSTCEERISNKGDNSEEVAIQQAPFNSTFSDYDAFPLEDKFYFSSTRPKGSDDISEDWLGQSYVSVWEAKENSAQPNLSEFFKSDYHIASLSFTADGKTVYFSKCGSEQLEKTDYCSIYRSKKEAASWTEPEMISFFGDSSNCGHPFISPDGSILYFSSDVKLGYGGKDLYFSTVQKNGSLSEPINLGAKVNTAYNEVFPFVTADGNTLFYASDNLQSYGGLDIFKASKLGRLFTSPERLPYGINSGRDDFALRLLPHDAKDTTIVWKAVLSSNRMKGTGNDDIYFATLKKTKPKPIPPGLLVLEGTVEEMVYENPENPNSKVLGKKSIPNPNVVLSGMNLDADKDGYFSTPLDSGLAYSLRVTKEGYLSAEINFNTLNLKVLPGDTLLLRQNVLLSKIFKNVEIVLENIYYDFDKWDIRVDAQPTLDSLALILQQNPNISIELASHTDCRGNDQYNMNLSQKRAESAVQYLSTKGINVTRMTAKGYGETQPVAQCECTSCTDEEHQKNRRTTFKIIQE